MRQRRVLFAFTGLNILALLLAVLMPLAAPTTAIADGGTGEPPINQPPPDTSGHSSVVIDDSSLIYGSESTVAEPSLLDQLLTIMYSII